MHSLGSGRELDTVSTAQYLCTSCICAGKRSNQYAFRLHLSRASLVCHLAYSPTLFAPFPALLRYLALTLSSSKGKTADKCRSHPYILSQYKRATWYCLQAAVTCTSLMQMLKQHGQRTHYSSGQRPSSLTVTACGRRKICGP